MEQTKWCVHCETAKPLSEFHRRHASADGLQPWCKTCMRRWSSETRGKYAQTEKGRKREAARRAARAAIRRGELAPESCVFESAECDGPVQAHHNDYDRPLDVVFACQLHHGRLDAATGTKKHAA